jgi:hypothetical protein
MRELIRVLKPGSQMIITLPFGRRMITHKHRIYNWDTIENLITKPLEINEVKFFIRAPTGWQTANQSEASKMDSPSLPVNAIVFLGFRKRNKL